MSAVAPSLSVKLIDGNTVSKTINYSQSGMTAEDYCQCLAKGGGFYDDNHVWHPTTAVVSVTISEGNG